MARCTRQSPQVIPPRYRNCVTPHATSRLCLLTRRHMTLAIQHLVVVAARQRMGMKPVFPCDTSGPRLAPIGCKRASHDPHHVEDVHHPLPQRTDCALTETPPSATLWEHGRVPAPEVRATGKTWLRPQGLSTRLMLGASVWWKSISLEFGRRRARRDGWDAAVAH